MFVSVNPISFQEHEVETFLIKQQAPSKPHTVQREISRTRLWSEGDQTLITVQQFTNSSELLIQYIYYYLL